MFTELNLLIICGVGVLLLFLFVIGILIYSSNSKTISYPPYVSDCPDYWYESFDKETNIGSKCYNVKHLGSSDCQEYMDFSTSDWTGSDSLCKKQTWANNCKVTWDGITNINHC